MQHAWKAVAVRISAVFDRKQPVIPLHREGGRIGRILRTGRTTNLVQREAQDARDPLLKDYDFAVDRCSDVYARQRGREPVIHELYDPPLDKIRAIRENHPKLQDYLDAA